MTTRKTTAEQIESAKLKLEQEKAKMQGLLQRHKSEERKKRTKRLIERGAIVESLIPEPEALTNEQIQIFLTKTIQTEFARRILNQLKAQDGEMATAKPETVAQGNATTTAPTESRSAAPTS